MNLLDGALLALTQFPLLVSIGALPRILQAAPRKRIVLHALFPLSQTMFIGLQMLYAVRNADWTYAAMLVCCSFICAVIGTTLVRHLVAADHREEETNRVQLLEVQTAAQRRRLKELQQESIGVRDDYRRFLRKLDDLDRTLRDGSSANQMEHSIQDASDVLCAHTTRICDNLVVDALLSMKAQEARCDGVDFHCAVQVGKVTPLSDVELCAVFANLCDNALHACERMGADGGQRGSGMDGAANIKDGADGTVNAERRWIRVRARIDESHCMVSVTNSCATSTPPLPC